MLTVTDVLTTCGVVILWSITSVIQLTLFGQDGWMLATEVLFVAPSQLTEQEGFILLFLIGFLFISSLAKKSLQVISFLKERLDQSLMPL